MVVIAAAIVLIVGGCFVVAVVVITAAVVVIVGGCFVVAVVVITAAIVLIVGSCFVVAVVVITAVLLLLLLVLHPVTLIRQLNLAAGAGIFFSDVFPLDDLYC